MNLRDSHILNHKQNLEWNWLLIATILKVRPAPVQLHILKRFLFPPFLSNALFTFSGLM